MTRINTNVGSLIGRNNLNRANASLSQSLTRLSTGLRINTGKDDPAGLIASENLRSDITSIKKAITNTDRANQVIATADSALGQVSSLLNDIRGLVTESANSGALSDDQIAANQLQIDSSLKALNRIAQTTTFQGRRLLDGSLDFQTSAGTDFSKLSALQINQANLGAAGEVNVDINVTRAATKASVEIGGITAGVEGAKANGSLSFTSSAPGTAEVDFELAGSADVAGTGSGNFTVQDVASTSATGTAVLETQVTGTLSIETEANAVFELNSKATGELSIGGNTIDLVAADGGNADGADGNDAAVLQINYGQGADTSSYDAGSGVLTVNVQALASAATIADVVTAINAGTDFTAASADGANTFTASEGDAATFALEGGGLELTLQALNDGDAGAGTGNAEISAIEIVSNGVNGTSFNTGTGVLTITTAADLTSAPATVGDIVTAINAGTDFSVDAAGLTAGELAAEFDLGAVNGTFTGATVAGAPTVTGQNESINLTALIDGTDASAIDSLTIAFGGPLGTSVAGNALTVNVGGADRNVTLQELVDAINAGSDFQADLGGADGSATFDPAGTVPDDDLNANFDLSLTPDSTIELTASASGAAAGIEGNSAATIAYSFGAATAGSAYDAGTNVLTVSLTQAEGTATVADLVSAINAGSDFTAAAGAANTAAVLQAADDSAAGTIALAGGVDATTRTESFTFNTVAGAGNDFDITFQTAATGSITDFDGGDSTVFGLSGSASQGYVVTLANDGTTNLSNLANDLAAAIGELDSVTFSGGAGDIFNPSTAPAGAAPSGVINVAGSDDGTTSNQTISLSGVDGGAAADVTFQFGTVLSGSTNITGDATNGYVVTIDDQAPVALSTIASDITAGIDGVTATFTGSGSVSDPSELITTNVQLTGGTPEGDDVITITADENGEAANRTIVFDDSQDLGAGAVSVTDDGTTITIAVDDDSDVNLSTIVSTLNSQLDGFTAALSDDSAGTGVYNGGSSTSPQLAQANNGATQTGGILADAVLELTGGTGAEVLNLKAGTTIDSIVEQINLTQDSTGVEASYTTDDLTGESTLILTSTTYGSKGVVGLDVISEDADGTFKTGLGNVKTLETGTDIEATVNGVAANGNGNKLSINTSTLELSTTVEAGFEGTSSFTITGGGANFQLGPDVVTNQQVRLGIGSVNTSALGGVSGLLYQLGQGESADLATDPTKAAAIVEESINQVTSLRGRLGAFQRTSLETNKNALNDTLANLTEAESSIRDADFAEETANLTRSQILVQSGTRVLGIANQNPQNVLSLLG
ncbi:beta strand repeat-containing protein [Botrimarina mediterranea]|uniref:Flagellin n=1 Tax=Botrimarina mediterranea TaxID=2528022 RepID=A0A518K4K7_9BACT|nr:flagellin [Botrimarina mediterranea]QDV72695.1 A-type flagellin [Botrimarina mediterranea]QDV77267.1 A-type flagellin [Planctomycetes bacterium K2D]